MTDLITKGKDPREQSGVWEYGFLLYDINYFLWYTVILSLHCNLLKILIKSVTHRHVSVVFWEIVASSVVCERKNKEDKDGDKRELRLRY